MTGCATPEKVAFKKRRHAESAATYAEKVSRQITRDPRCFCTYRCACGAWHLTTRKEHS